MTDVADPEMGEGDFSFCSISGNVHARRRVGRVRRGRRYDNVAAARVADGHDWPDAARYDIAHLNVNLAAGMANRRRDSKERGRGRVVEEEAPFVVVWKGLDRVAKRG